MKKAAVKANVRSSFSPHRYPRVQEIVDPGSDDLQLLSDKVGEKILTEIIRGKIPAGSELSSTLLAEQFGVSRTPLARALSQLIADGILIQRTKQPAIVNPAAADWMTQTRSLRRLLEPEAAFLSCGNIPEDVFDDLWTLSHEAAPLPDRNWIPAAAFFDAALHLSIAEFCQNLPFKVAIRKCWSYKKLAYELSDKSSVRFGQEYVEHLEILQALAEEDAKSARKLMEEHLRTT
ncbi:GntR family transcriptional regulator [Bythopirellula goksoeyrii]|uniref:L-lactate dehydrogenase operon regulatory protein n=1 Tax=Bythopirellula goksoeyrii TaxID=1400387 RepID=A0A5B9QC31_9BACT|nr:GntR family transcriptional regulator [Bythopirellula goksoeyrii]QEG35150.1 Putative L-lactate dehydrogenase operon regulatory protein [Bythopirellula goksoeyrii]